MTNEEQRLQFEIDLRKIMRQPAGRRVLDHYMRHCGIDRQTYSSEANDTAFNEGMRAVGLKMRADIGSTSPDEFLLLLKENLSAMRSREVEGSDENAVRTGSETVQA